MPGGREPMRPHHGAPAERSLDEVDVNFIENETAEKLRGGYYTPPDIARFLTRWVLQSKPRSVLEPSCGDGAFLRAMVDLGARSTRVTACELSPVEAAKARQEARSLHATVLPGDFLSWVLDRIDTPPDFDGVLGNPPFVRYQYLADELQRRAESVIRKFGLRFTMHTNAWVPFVVASLARLRPGGRVAMVVPAELLHVLHAGPAREYLLRECSRVLVLDPEEIWFEGTLQGVVLLLAEKRERSGSTRGSLAILRSRGREILAQDPGRLFESAGYLPGESLPHKWTLALLGASERRVLDTLQRHESVRRFADVAKAAVGIVTGANKFFLVPDSVVDAYDLSRFAHPMFGRSEHVPGVAYSAATHRRNRRLGYPTNFLWFNGEELLTHGARRYLAEGEREGLDRRFKCRIRDPWYAVPSVFTAPIGMLKRSHDYPRLVLNTAKAFTTDTAYRVTPAPGIGAGRLVYCFVNRLTALCAELEGRHYGGGVLELVPSEIGRLLVPLVPAERSDLQRLDAMFMGQTSAPHILEFQDEKILGRLGLSPRTRQDVFAAWWALRSRRQRVGAERPLASSDGGFDEKWRLAGEK